ncbi:MAG: transposase [Gammaproteobacteria bacterium]
MSVLFDPERQHRRSIRLRGYDYTQAGAYFVTIVVQDRACLFGEVVDGHMRLDDAGRMVAAEWDALCPRFMNIDLDAFVVMPNHIHGIIVITGTIGTDGSTVGAPLVGAQSATGGQTTAATVGAALAAQSTTGHIVGAPLVGAQSTTGGQSTGAIGASRATTRVAPTLGKIVGTLKSLTTVAYTRGVKTHGWSPFRERLWQRNYFEHIVHNEDSLQRIRQYIADNPANWTDDPENPQRIVGAVPRGRPDAEQMVYGPGANPDSEDPGHSHESGHPRGVPLQEDKSP